MARSGVRIQVLLPTEVAEEVESISKSESVSLSRVVGSIVEAYRTSDEYRTRLAHSKAKLDAVKEQVLAAIAGADLSHDKVKSIIDAIERLES